MMEMICINCPMGCVLEVIQEEADIIVKGNQCKKGIEYAIHECTAPTRMITSSLYIVDGNYPVVPVKTNIAVPKDRIFDILRYLKTVKCNAPVCVGDILVENILDLGINIVATKHIEKVN